MSKTTLVLFLCLSSQTCQEKGLEMILLLHVVGLPHYDIQGSIPPSLFYLQDKEFRPGISVTPTSELVKINPQYGTRRDVDPLADYP